MKAKLYAFLISKLGWFVKAPIAAGIGWLALQTAKLGVDLPKGFQEQLAATAVALVVAVGESWLRKQDDKNKVIVQKELGLPPEDQDGYHGPVTVAAAKAAVVPAKSTPKKPRRTFKHQSRP